MCKNRFHIIGITGSFGSGKTTVARMFEYAGALRIDADRIYHQLIQPGRVLYKKLILAFGRQILNKKRRIDRKRLGEIVFADQNKLRRLSRLTHPPIIKMIKAKLNKLGSRKLRKIVIIDAPLLIEEGSIAKLIDMLIVVKTSRKNQIARCKKKRDLSPGEIKARINSQMPLGEKIRKADFVIDNNGTMQETRKQVREVLKSLV